MKSKIIMLQNSLFVLGLLIVFSGCTKLSFQDKFEFNPEVPELTPFKDITAWEFLERNPNGEFTYMKKVIELAGLKDSFSVNKQKHTFLLLKDAAFTASGQAIQALTGKTNGNLDTVNVERLRKFVRYHTLEDYVDQGPDYTKVTDVEYFFQSLVPGEEGKVSIKRNVWLSFHLNSSPLLPATKKGTNQISHNYIFKNGIAHILNTQYIRAVPF